MVIAPGVGWMFVRFYARLGPPVFWNVPGAVIQKFFKHFAVMLYWVLLIR